jgi:hypothetical protein
MFRDFIRLLSPNLWSVFSAFKSFGQMEKGLRFGQMTGLLGIGSVCFLPRGSGSPLLFAEASSFPHRSTTTAVLANENLEPVYLLTRVRFSVF